MRFFWVSTANKNFEPVSFQFLWLNSCHVQLTDRWTNSKTSGSVCSCACAVLLWSVLFWSALFYSAVICDELLFVAVRCWAAAPIWAGSTGRGLVTRSRQRAPSPALPANQTGAKWGDWAAIDPGYWLDKTWLIKEGCSAAALSTYRLSRRLNSLLWRESSTQCTALDDPATEEQSRE